MKALYAALFAIAMPAIAFAQDSRVAVFEAGAQHENVPGGLLLLIGYGSVFVFLLVYVVILGVRQGRVARDLETLRRDLEKREGK
jgi:hypothetical protein